MPNIDSSDGSDNIDSAVPNKPKPKTIGLKELSPIQQKILKYAVLAKVRIKHIQQHFVLKETGDPVFPEVEAGDLRRLDKNAGKCIRDSLTNFRKSRGEGVNSSGDKVKYTALAKDFDPLEFLSHKPGSEMKTLPPFTTELYYSQFEPENEEIKQNSIEPTSVPFPTHPLALQSGIHPTSMQGVMFALTFDRAQERFANDRAQERLARFAAEKDTLIFQELAEARKERERAELLAAQAAQSVAQFAAEKDKYIFQELAEARKERERTALLAAKEKKESTDNAIQLTLSHKKLIRTVERGFNTVEDGLESVKHFQQSATKETGTGFTSWVTTRTPRSARKAYRAGGDESLVCGRSNRVLFGEDENGESKTAAVTREDMAEDEDNDGGEKMAAGLLKEVVEEDDVDGGGKMVVVVEERAEKKVEASTSLGTQVDDSSKEETTSAVGCASIRLLSSAPSSSKDGIGSSGFSFGAVEEESVWTTVGFELGHKRQAKVTNAREENDENEYDWSYFLVEENNGHRFWLQAPCTKTNVKMMCGNCLKILERGDSTGCRYRDKTHPQGVWKFKSWVVKNA